MYKVVKWGRGVVKSSRFHETFGYWKITFIQSSSIQETYLKRGCTSLVIGRVHSFQSSSIQETYLKGVVHH